MSPVDYLLLIYLPFILIYLWLELKKCEKKATRIKEQEAAFNVAFNKWCEDSSIENYREMRKIMEERYGQET